MPNDLIARRERVLDRHDAALGQWPDRTDAKFKVELAAVAEELDEIAQALDVAGADPIECSRSWRFVGDAFFDLARGRDLEPLQRAAAAYDRAEKRLDSADAPIERAKLDFNYANTLRGMSGGRDRALLEEVLLRYQMALGAFKHHAPQNAPTVQAALDTLGPQLKMLDTFERTKAGYESLRRAADALVHSPDDPDLQQKTRELLKSMQRRRSDLLKDAIGAVQDFKQPVTLADRLGEMIGQLQSAGGVGDNPFQRLFPMLLARFRAEIDAGRIAPERQAALEPILAELQQLINQPDGDLDASVARMGQLRQLMTGMIALLDRPSTGASPPPAGSRAERISQYEGALARHLAAEHLPANMAAGERDAASALFEELSKVRSALPGVATDAARTLAHESDLLRPLALRAEQFSLRHHLTLARPFWALPKQSPDPSGIYACGAPTSESLLDDIASELALKRVRPGAGADAGQARSNAIAAARVVVCDLRAAAGPELAAACYEIGLAKALGRALVIVVAQDSQLPFDIEVAPTVLKGTAADHAALAGAIDDALYLPPHRETDSSLAATVAELQRRYAASPTFGVRKSLELVQQAAADPVEARQRIESLLGFVGADAPRTMFPAWPGDYPEPGARRLFHVMPFSLDWSKTVRDMVAAACKASGMRYVRGDEVPDPRVIRSIWDEICRASHVLVDLSDFNANVALELGLVHGLGRHVLLVGRDETVKRLFPTIRKVRMLPYSRPPELQDAVATFIKAERGSLFS
jgi:hypothetical protein